MLLKLTFVLFSLMSLTGLTLGACPSGWKQFQTNCYMALPPKSTIKGFVGADAACTARGAHLASIHSEPENKFVFSLGQQMSPSLHIWFGLRTPDGTPWTAGKYFYMDGTPVDYGAPTTPGVYPWTNKQVAAPDNAGGVEFCAHIIGYDVPWGNAGEWNDIACNTTGMVAVCKMPAPQPSVCLTCTAVQICQGIGWNNFQTSCYKALPPETLGFADAESKCVAEGGHLTSIHSEDENKFVFTLSQAVSTQAHTWFGLRTPEGTPWTEGKYFYMDATAVDYGAPTTTGVYPWANKLVPTPDYAGGVESCAHIIGYDVPWGNAGEWNDIACNTTGFSAVCEKAAVTECQLQTPPLAARKKRNEL